MFKMQNSGIDERRWIEIEKEVQATQIDILVDMLVPIFEKKLTLQDLKELIAFYNTPIGKKYAKIQSESLEGMMKIGELFCFSINRTFVIQKYV